MNKQNSASIWQEYVKGVNYNNSILLYDQVKKNENFYLSKQWEGLNAPDLEQPVLNFLRPATTYMISMLVSDDVGVSIDTFGNAVHTDVLTVMPDAATTESGMIIDPLARQNGAGAVGNEGIIDPLAGQNGAGVAGNGGAIDPLAGQNGAGATGNGGIIDPLAGQNGAGVAGNGGIIDPLAGQNGAGVAGNGGIIDPLVGQNGAGAAGNGGTIDPLAGLDRQSLAEFPAGKPDIGKLLAQEIERVIERTKAKSKNRDALRNAAVDGDCCFFLRFDVGDNPNDPGEIVIDQVDNTNIIFGNPFVDRVQEQPYLIVVKRSSLQTVRQQARRDGVPDWESIIPDTDSNYCGEEDAPDNDLVTVLIKLWKDEDGFVHFCKTTQNVMLKADTNLGYRLYPVAYMSWEKIKNSYHGMPAITPGVIANQIYVNTLWALFMIHCKQMAFPKMFYDRTKIKQWTNKVGQAIGVTGDPNLAVAGGFRAPDFSEQALMLVEKTMQYTREFMGVSDAALGNVKPDNTSAIIAVQKASATPLELQRLSFYQFVEDYVRIIMDIIRTDYGLRWVRYRDDGDTQVEALVDFSSLPYDAMDLKVEVGSAAYWSELTQIQTTDNLFAKGVITDAVTYLEAIPDAYVKNKQKIIDQLREREQQPMLTQPLGGNLAMPTTGMQ